MTPVSGSVLWCSDRQMVKCGPAEMRVCSLGLGIRLGLVLGIGLVLRLVMLLGLAYFTFCHTSSPQKPASPLARVLPIAVQTYCNTIHKAMFRTVYMIAI